VRLEHGAKGLSRAKHSTALAMARTAICADSPKRERISV
jgi:hypothetical protein